MFRNSMIKNKPLMTILTIFTFLIITVLTLYRPLENRLGEMPASIIIVISIIGLLMYFVPKIGKFGLKIKK